MGFIAQTKIMELLLVFYFNIKEKHIFDVPHPRNSSLCAVVHCYLQFFEAKPYLESSYMVKTRGFCLLLKYPMREDPAVCVWRTDRNVQLLLRWSVASMVQSTWPDAQARSLMGSKLGSWKFPWKVQQGATPPSFLSLYIYIYIFNIHMTYIYIHLQNWVKLGRYPWKIPLKMSP